MFLSNIEWFHYLIFAAISFIPVAFWMWFFLEEEKTSRHLAYFTFFLGTFSVVPLLIYQKVFLTSEKWWVYNITNQLNLGGNAGLNEFLQFIGLFGLLAVFTLLVAFVLVIFGTFFRKENFKKNLFGVFEEMSNFTLLGVFTVILIIVFHFFKISLVGALSATILLAAFEEYAKHLVVRFVDQDKFKSIDQAIIFSALVGLGFAFTENIVVYFPKVWGTSAFIEVVIVRSALLVFAHALFSGIFGYFYGIGYFAKPLLVQRVVSRPHTFFTNSLQKLLHLKSEPSYREKRMMTGLIIATAMHAVFNTLMQQNMIMYAGGLVVVGGAFLYILLEKKENHKKFGLVGTRWVPNQIEFMNAINAVREAKEKEEKNSKK